MILTEEKTETADEKDNSEKVKKTKEKEPAKNDVQQVAKEKPQDGKWERRREPRNTFGTGLKRSQKVSLKKNKNRET